MWVNIPYMDAMGNGFFGGSALLKSWDLCMKGLSLLRQCLKKSQSKEPVECYLMTSASELWRFIYIKHPSMNAILFRIRKQF